MDNGRYISALEIPTYAVFGVSRVVGKWFGELMFKKEG